MSRQLYLTEVVNAFLEARKQWVESDTPYITEALEERVEEVIEAFAAGDVPGDLRRTEKTVSLELAPAWREWRRRAAQSGDTTLMPSETFWLAVEHLSKATDEAKPRPARQIESVEELKAQKVSDAQICRIYGWVDGHGAAQIWKLQEELREPGKHTSGWVNPAELRRREQAAREQAVAERIRQRQQKKLSQLTEPCPETIEQLLAQNVCLSQIVKLRKCTREEVAAECERLGIALPPENYADVRTARAPAEPDLPEAAARAFGAASRRGRAAKPEEEGSGDEEEDELLGEELAEADDGAAVEMPAGAMTLEQEIVYYHREGLDPDSIASSVSTEDRAIKVGKVNAVLKRFAKDPEAFA